MGMVVQVHTSAQAVEHCRRVIEHGSWGCAHVFMLSCEQ